MATIDTSEAKGESNESRDIDLKGKGTKEVAALLRRSLTALKKILDGDELETTETFEGIKQRIRERRDKLNKLVRITSTKYDDLFAEAAKALETKEQRNKGFSQVDKRKANVSGAWRNPI